MDDCCAVCAEPLEWLAYGSCGHREVCSTCVVRLRFVLDDRRCCICKAESPSVFVTKAMGDYTRMIADFSTLPSSAGEGQVGEFWYHEDSQAYFDDVEHYRMIKAMCRLSCSVCDSGGGEEQQRRTAFRSMHQLKGHLFHRHKLFMCSLCLEGRKVFICEQKLYTRSQLHRHISTGDSEVDGNESERGGFNGHPSCEFCKTPFYGDNELYMHMSRDHYTCHICQRRNPGQYDYFKNYDDLEIHFRQEHFLCEDEACLAEKFVVFQSEAELKRHNAIKHGGNMSRSKRNAALVLPTSFRFRQTAQGRRGRGGGYSHNSDSPLAFSFGIQYSSQTAADGRPHDSSTGPTVSEAREVSLVDAATGSLGALNINPDVGAPLRGQNSDRLISNAIVLEESGFPALSEREIPEPSLRYAQALSTSNAPSNLRESSFPPLPGVSVNNPPLLEPKSTGNSLATRVAKTHSQRKSTVKVSQRSAGSRGSESSSSAGSSQAWPSIQNSISGPSRPKPTPTVGILPSNRMSSQINPSSSDRFPTLASSSKTNGLNHSSSAPDLVSSGHSSVVSGDIRAANQSLVEKIRVALEMDDDRFAAFKSISAEYRQGQIGAAEYVSYAQQFGLSHLIVDLAQLCPDTRKQKELIDIYKANLQYKQSAGSSNITSSSNEISKSRKQKGKAIVTTTENTGPTAKLTDEILSTVKKLQENYRPGDEDAERLSKDGYRIDKGRSVSAPAREPAAPNSSVLGSSMNETASAQDPGGTFGKPRKKTSKFNRVRLGDGSAAALFGLTEGKDSPERPKESSSSQGDGVPVRGVWKNGGGQRLFGTSTKGLSK